jgi:hypothetical protein
MGFALDRFGMIVHLAAPGGCRSERNDLRDALDLVTRGLEVVLSE